MLAILAMDAYNQGYDPGLKNWGHTPISAKAQPRSLDEPTPLSAKTAEYGVKYA